MALRFVSLALAVWCVAADGQISADFDKACQAGQQDCVDISEDMNLIQKKIEVGSSTIQTKDKKHAAKKGVANKKQAAKKDSHGPPDGEIVTTKGGVSMEIPYCPLGYEARAGSTQEKMLFGEAPDSVAATRKSCASDCTNHTDCKAFEFDEGEMKCYLSTERDPRSRFPDPNGLNLLFCSKVPNCTFVWPWAYFNETESTEVNVWNAWNTAHRCWVPWTMWCLVSWAIWSLLAILVWKVAFGPEPELYEDPEDPVKTWEEGHFDCMRRPKICCCAFFCPAVQWANTMHLAGFLHMGTALAIYLILAFFNGYFTPVPQFDADWSMGDNGDPDGTVQDQLQYNHAYLTGTGWFPTGIYTAIVMLIFRQKLRARLGRYADTCPTWFFDCCFVLWCPCCAIAQEAMVVQYSYQQGRKEPAVRSGVADVRTSGRVPVPTGQTLRPTTRPDLRGVREWNY